ncbi:MAG: toprim domain-containing protein [Thermodesulfobacteriota bacterium]
MTNKGIDYLFTKRYLDFDVIEKFKLCYCDEYGDFITRGVDNYLDFTMPKIDPRFYDSAIFPIFDLYGKVIGVSARSLSDTNDLKYINTVYTKGRHLYGLNLTWYDCLQKRKVYVVEGNVDVVRMYQAGVKNVVGMLGSTLSVTQLAVLSRFVDEVIFVPDGDKAGAKFLERVAIGTPNRKSLTSKHTNLNLRFSLIKLPEGLDPDSFLNDHTAEDLFKLEEPVTSDLFITYHKKLGGKTDEW